MIPRSCSGQAGNRERSLAIARDRPGTGGSVGGRLLVAGVGYRNLRDHSLGVVLTDQLAVRSWPDSVSIEDLSFNPIAVVQRLEDDPPERRFTRAIVVSSVSRGTRMPGAVTAYRWDRVLPPADEIHRAVCDAVTGVIHVDNTLVVTRHFGALPDDVVVIEVEPFIHEFGDELSAPVAGAFERVEALVISLVNDDDAWSRLPPSSLGGADAIVAAHTNGPPT